jgi:transposase
MNSATFCPGWCARADALLDVPGIHLFAVENTGREQVITVETDQIFAGCPVCGVVAIGHGRRVVRLNDTPARGRPVRLDWATDALSRYDTLVSALAYQLGVSWHTLWKPVKAEAERRTTIDGRLSGVDALGFDEHVWTHTGFTGSGMVASLIDHTRNANGVVHVRLLDLVEGRSGKTYADWLKAQTPQFRTGIKTATLDPFRGFANAIRDVLPDALTVLDAFHVVKLASAMVDDVRRRVQ